MRCDTNLAATFAFYIGAASSREVYQRSTCQRGSPASKLSDTMSRRHEQGWLKKETRTQGKRVRRGFEEPENITVSDSRQVGH